MQKAKLLVLALFFQGCATLTPLVQDFNIVSIPQETALGEAVAKQVGAQMQVIDHTQEAATVRAIGNSLLRSLVRKDFDYTFHLVQDSAPNAFTIPGGHIYVHTGLLKFVENHDELAGVIAHEIGHAYERHPTKALSRAYGAQFLTQMLVGEEATRFQKLAVSLLQGGVLNKYGRDDERESDYIAYELIKRSSFDPNGLVNFFKKLSQLQGRDRTLPFLRSHPTTPERIANLEALLRQDNFRLRR